LANPQDATDDDKKEVESHNAYFKPGIAIGDAARQAQARLENGDLPSATIQNAVCCPQFQNSLPKVGLHGCI